MVGPVYPARYRPLGYELVRPVSAEALVTTRPGTASPIFVKPQLDDVPLFVIPTPSITRRAVPPRSVRDHLEGVNFETPNRRSVSK